MRRMCQPTREQLHVACEQARTAGVTEAVAVLLEQLHQQSAPMEEAMFAL